MGRFIVLTSATACVVGGHDVTVEVQVPVVLPPDDAPDELGVGDRLTPLVVEHVAELLVALRTPVDIERGAALFLWFCPRCLAYRWVRADFDTVDGEAVLAGMEVVRAGPAALEEASWIDPELVKVIVAGTPAAGVVPLTGTLDREQYDALAAAVGPGGGSAAPPGGDL